MSASDSTIGSVDRYLLIVSTICFLAAVAHTCIELRAGLFRPMRFNFVAIGLGFVFQTAFLSIRGHTVGRCPLTNLFEVFIFLAWSIALIYILVCPAYRLSLMGAFTLACIAGVMYLVQERQLKTHQLHSIFYHLPPLADLFAVITRLLWLGFVLYTVGLVSGFFVGHPLPYIQVVCAAGVWVLYALILQGRHLQRLAPKHVAALSIVGFSAALTLLWGITFTAQTTSPP